MRLYNNNESGMLPHCWFFTDILGAKVSKPQNQSTEE